MESTSTLHLQRSRGSNGLPRVALYGAVGLAVLTMVLVFTDQTLDALRGEGTVTAPQTTYQLWFDDRANGDIAVRAAFDAAPVAVLAGADHGFLRTVVRSLAHIRAREELDRQAPFQLVRWTDGTMILADPVTGQYMPLNGFGRDNEAPFLALLATIEQRP